MCDTYLSRSEAEDFMRLIDDDEAYDAVRAAPRGAVNDDSWLMRGSLDRP